MVTTLPLMLHDPGVLELSMPNDTARPDEAVPDNWYGVCVRQGLHGGVDVIVMACDACATVIGC